MDKKSENSDAVSEASGKSSVFTDLHRDPKYRKANAEFLTRRLRLEFDKQTTTRPLCKNTLKTLPFPIAHEKRHHFKLKNNAKKQPGKRSNIS